MISEKKLDEYKKVNMQEVLDANGVRDELVAEIRRLRRALTFYAGHLREDENGYEFDFETFKGSVARKALGRGDQCRRDDSRPSR